MSRLRAASQTFARTGAHPLLSMERLLATERVAAGLEARRMAGAASWDDLVRRAVDEGVAALATAELRRLLAGVWADRRHAPLASALVGRMVELARRSLDRALIERYLLDHPADHPAFGALRAAAAVAADRHAWGWREAGRTWRLWDGPGALGDALRQAPDAALLMREAGFAGRLADGAFVSAARADAARSAR